MDITNIEKINKIIVDELIKQYSELLYGDINVLYNDIRHMTARVTQERKKTIEERITLSSASLQEVQDKVNETKKNKDAIKQCQKQLQAALNSLDKSTKKRLDAIVSQLV